jgi:hypothetical protein
MDEASYEAPLSRNTRLDSSILKSDNEIFLGRYGISQRNSAFGVKIVF